MHQGRRAIRRPKHCWHGAVTTETAQHCGSQNDGARRSRLPQAPDTPADGAGCGTDGAGGAGDAHTSGFNCGQRLLVRPAEARPAVKPSRLCYRRQTVAVMLSPPSPAQARSSGQKRRLKVVRNRPCIDHVSQGRKTFVQYPAVAHFGVVSIAPTRRPHVDLQHVPDGSGAPTQAAALPAPLLRRLLCCR